MSNRTEIQELYTKKAHLYHRIFFDLLKYDKAAQAFLLKENYLHSQMRVLDAGCGSGLITKILLAISKQKKLSGIAVNAFDVTKTMLSLFNKWIAGRNIPNLEVKQADVLELGKLPKQWKDYDLIISSAMLEHLSQKEMETALAGLRDLLKKKGILIILITKRNLVTHWLVKRWWNAQPYKKAEIQKLFFRVGFHNLQFKEFPRPYRYLNRGVLIIETKK